MSRRLTSFPRCVLSCPPFFHLAYPPDLHLHQTSDRTARMCEAITRYDGCEFIPVRMQDVFDRNWWERVSGGAASNPSPTELPVDLHGEGSCDRPSVELSQIITLEGCATLSTGRPLFDLLGVFKKWLRVYAGEHAPRIGSAVINPSLRFAASTQNCASSMLVSPPSMLTPPLLQTSSQPPLIAAVASANTAAHASTL